MGLNLLIMISKLAQQGIVHHKSCVYTLQQNSIVERKRKHLLQIARSLAFQANLQKGLGEILFSWLLLS